MRIRNIPAASFPVVVIAVVLTVVGCIHLKTTTAEQANCTIAVMADPRAGGDSWRNALKEVRDGSASSNDVMGLAELIIVAGDMDPLEERHRDYQEVFASSDEPPLLLPVVGNHEFENGGAHFRYMRDELIPAIPGVVRRHPTACDYYLDYKNVRVIAVDAYTDLGKAGVINEEGRAWVEQCIAKAPPAAEHVFVCFHEPAFPRHRHLNDSFNQGAEQRDSFWRMLLEHRNRVSAVLVGHTHAYSRIRVADPASKAANDPNSCPDEQGGIYQVDAGAAGNGKECTVVQIRTRGRHAEFRTIQSERGEGKPFKEADRWSLKRPVDR